LRCRVKFWAGLTDNQPVSYLEKLASYPQPTVLLVIAPSASEHTLWRELNHRLLDASISVTERDTAAGVFQSVATLSLTALKEPPMIGLMEPVKPGHFPFWTG